MDSGVSLNSINLLVLGTFNLFWRVVMYLFIWLHRLVCRTQPGEEHHSMSVSNPAYAIQHLCTALYDAECMKLFYGKIYLITPL